MAAMLPSLFFNLCLLLLPFIFPTFHKAHSVPECYTSIITFGNSLTDTGNFLYSRHIHNKTAYMDHLPYGETYFHYPTGRSSDGRLISDFIAEAFGLPYPPPYLARRSGEDFKQGVNFAVAGATALDAAFFEERGIPGEYNNSSLRIQLNWFEEFLSSICPKSTDCRDMLRRSLLFVGEIGGNDYNHPIFQGKDIPEFQSFVPQVIDTIGSAISNVIRHGATTLVVPGILPFGCSSVILTYFQTSNEKDYNPKTGCLKRFNKFSRYHNHLLQKELGRMRLLYPNVTIIYADYYNAAMRIYRSPSKYGFSKGALRACCGGGGPYNFNKSVRCGYGGAKVCDDPSSYVSWDGLHLTEAAYRWIASSLLQGPYSTPPIHSPCLSLPTHIQYPHSE